MGHGFSWEKELAEFYQNRDGVTTRPGDVRESCGLI